MFSFSLSHYQNDNDMPGVSRFPSLISNPLTLELSNLLNASTLKALPAERKHKFTMKFQA